jgi:hypothetical protein
MTGVYAVTTYERTARRKLGDKVVRNRRTVGIFPDFEAAERTVLRNYGDIEEAGYYQYAVVEFVPFGLYSLEREQWWYEFNLETERWEKSDTKPEPLAAMFHRMVDWSDIG